jgi:3-methyladenine DNA glycosylase AlkD
MKAKHVTAALKKLGNPVTADHSRRFFKTGKGQYGEGDRFLGIRVPVIRQQVKLFRDISLDETLILLRSPLHEVRLFALLMLVRKFSKGDERLRATIYKTYLSNTRYINHWDLVDSSASTIVGGWLQERDRQPLYRLAKSKQLWERRIAMLATFDFIRNREFDDALAISELLMNDPEDLMHKAVGWMLREIGNRNARLEKVFLKQHYKHMPRTMLRYAIEKFPEKERQRYLSGTI